VRDLEGAQAQGEADRLLRSCGLERITHLTLASFVPQYLAGDEEAHPYHVATDWLAEIADLPEARYDVAESPVCALFFYCPGRGRGKTHLAAALALEARRRGKLAAFVEENSFLDRLGSCPFKDREEVLRTPGERAWLTVIDDLGQKEAPSDSVRNAWYGVINRRWLARGWTIITSNYTLDQLLARKTINEATYSRLMQMTRGSYVYFDGADRRLVEPH
jgi:hypothetical protein